MKFRLEEIAEALGTEVSQEIAKQTAGGWSIDSRTIETGEIFFALRGPQHDGHKFVADVLRKGTLAAIVDHSPLDLPANGAGRILRVADTLAALQRLAGWARQRWGGSIVAVTGSAGKTTTKDVIAEMLSVGMKTAKSAGNLNNHIGLPLSLLRLDESARVAVVEMGMNHTGEIRELAEIAKPNVAVVTNVGFAHIENFNSIEGIAAAKRELVESLSSDGTAVLNADDSRVAQFASVHKGRVVTYGESADADIRALDVQESATGVRFRIGQISFESTLNGRHNVSNILAGVAVAGIFGIPPERLTETVRALKPGNMRGERLEHNGVLIYNDCYNSNPEAARAMLDVLAQTPARKRIAILGEMLELGAKAPELHQQVGRYAAERKIDVLIGVKGEAAEMTRAAKAAGLAQALFFEDPEGAGRFARGLAQAGDVILFKGSRGVRVERALQGFMKSEVGGGPN